MSVASVLETPIIRSSVSGSREPSGQPVETENPQRPAFVPLQRLACRRITLRLWRLTAGGQEAKPLTKQVASKNGLVTGAAWPLERLGR